MAGEQVGCKNILLLVRSTDQIIFNDPDYDIAWSTGLDNGEVDAGIFHRNFIEFSAIHDSGISRFTNFYIEGLLELLVNQPKLDGLYLDEVAFSRNTFLRMRRTMDNEKSGNLFDLHSCNKFDCPVDSQGTVLHVCTKFPRNFTP